MNLDALRSSFSGEIVTPADPTYKTAIERWAINAQRPAKLVAFVKTYEDISLAFKYAAANALPIAVRGGGHSASGASSVTDGVVVDLSRYFASVTVDAENRLAFVGGGAVWETVDKEAIKHGLATVGGTVNHTGVGGLVLGGGYGWLSGMYGLAIDNLTQLTVVVADGRVLTVNKTDHSDLYWALRGGGSNFGVVTEFVLELHPQRRTVFAGPIIFLPQSIEQVLQAVKSWHAHPKDHEAMTLVLTRGPDGSPCVVLIVFYNGPEEEGRANFKAFFDLGPAFDLTAEIPFENLNALQNPNAPHGKNVYMKGVTQLEPNSDVTKKVFDAMQQMTESGDLHVALMFEYFPLAKIRSVRSDATAFCSRGPQSNVLFFGSWENNTPELSKKGKEAAHLLTSLVMVVEKPPKPDENKGYSNYDDVALQDIDHTARRKLYGGNYERLLEIKQKYDPTMFFSKWV